MSRPIDAFTKHVELLRPLLTENQPMFVTPASADAPERILWREMKDSGLVDCVYRSDHMGIPSDFANITITSSGRAFVAEFDAVPEPEKKKTNWAMVSALIALAVFAAAVIWKVAEVISQ